MVEISKASMAVVTLIVLFVVVLILLSTLWPTLEAAFGNMAASNAPLASLFAPTGVLAIIFIVGIFVALVYVAFKGIRE